MMNRYRIISQTHVYRIILSLLPADGGGVFRVLTVSKFTQEIGHIISYSRIVVACAIMAADVQIRILYRSRVVETFSVCKKEYYYSLFQIPYNYF